MGLFLHGEALYGRVDKIPGVGCVATTFHHYLLVPVYPERTYFVPEDATGLDVKHSCVPIAFSTASVVRGYLEGLCLAGCVFGALAAIPLLSGGRSLGALCGGVALALGLIGIVLTRLLPSKASYARAKEVAERVGLRSRAWIELDLYYGQITPAEAGERRAQLQSRIDEKRAARDSERLQRRAKRESERVGPANPELHKKAPRRRRRGASRA